MAIQEFNSGDVLDELRLNEIVDDVNELTDPNPWQVVPFQNGWVNYGSGYSPFGFFKDDNGVVHLRGLITNGASGSTYASATLPLGYRPPYRVLAQGQNSGGSVRIDINTSGQIIMYNTGSGWVSLECISFRSA